MDRVAYSGINSIRKIGIGIRVIFIRPYNPLTCRTGPVFIIKTRIVHGGNLLLDNISFKILNTHFAHHIRAVPNIKKRKMNNSIIADIIIPCGGMRSIQRNASHKFPILYFIHKKGIPVSGRQINQTVFGYAASRPMHFSRPLSRFAQCTYKFARKTVEHKDIGRRSTTTATTIENGTIRYITFIQLPDQTFIRSFQFYIFHIAHNISQQQGIVGRNHMVCQIYNSKKRVFIFFLLLLCYPYCSRRFASARN